MSKYRVEIPQEAMENTEIPKSGPLVMRVHRHQLVIEPENLASIVPQIKMSWYILPAILVAILVFSQLYADRIQLVPLSGPASSLGNIITAFGGLCGIGAFIITFISEKIKRTGPAQQFSWRMLLPIAMASGLILVFTVYALFWVLSQLFGGATFDIYTACIMIAISIAVINYIMINLSMTLSPGVITNLMTIMILGGVLFSMLTNGRKNWWRYNFSYLGTAQSGSSMQFNLTLIFTGILMATLVDYLFVNLKRRYHNWRIEISRWMLFGLAACLAGVGLFPNNREFHYLHDQISMWLVYLLLILIIILRWILPMISNNFLRLSYLMGAVMAAEYIAFKFVHYLSLTAFELLSFGLALSWTLLLFQNLEYLIQSDSEILDVDLVVIKHESNDQD